jgi:hypothetical protein
MQLQEELKLIILQKEKIKIKEHDKNIMKIIRNLFKKEKSQRKQQGQYQRKKDKVLYHMVNLMDHVIEHFVSTDIDIVLFL